MTAAEWSSKPCVVYRKARSGSVTSERQAKIESATYAICAMNTRDYSPPLLQGGFHTWSFRGDHNHIAFLGKGPQRQRQRAFEDVVGNPGLRLSWPDQIHSATVVAAHERGSCGNADALTTTERGVALSIATADCVPIVIAGQRRLAAIHAGWRGLVGRVIQGTLDELAEEPSSLKAWIGPAIGACCYEVGEDVASQVTDASDPAVRIHREPRPHLDLAAAAEWQLSRAGVEQVHTVSVCTRCSPAWLWSYRRDQDDAGRNWTFAWLE